MKALVHTGPLRLDLQDRPSPIPGPGEVLLRVRAVAICGSDVHGYTGTTGRRLPPIVMGHEASGTVEAVGDGVDGWMPGARVTFDSIVWCGDYFDEPGEEDYYDNVKDGDKIIRIIRIMSRWG